MTLHGRPTGDRLGVLPGTPYPRVLIVTVNPLSRTSNNGKTFSSFFRDYPKANLGQLYFHREAPSSDVCDRYYRIGDEEFIRYSLRRTRVLGRRAFREDVAETMLPKRVANAAKKSSLMRLLRLAAWTRLRLTEPGVSQWVAEFDPEIIFFCGGDANYLYLPVLGLANSTTAPLVFYVTDDYALPDTAASWPERVKRAWTRRLLGRAMTASSLVLTIGEAMSDVYTELYGVRSEHLMNLVDLPADIPNSFGISDTDAVISYVGGLHLNRWRVLLRVADSLQRISERFGQEARLAVYAAEVPPEAAGAFSIHPRIEYCGSVPSNEVPDVLASSRALLHVESFDSDARRATRLSVSTKIPEYLSSGRCVVAVGPPEVASIRYLADAGAAFVVSDEDDERLDSQVRAALMDEARRRSVIDHGIALARRNHDGVQRREWFHEQLRLLVDKGNEP